MKNKKEMPLLKSLGLYAAKTDGYGNCLFNALSDQLYGDDSQHMDLRTKTVEYMRAHADDYKSFIAVHEGGGTRRNPKRKTAGSLQNRPDFTYMPSQEDKDKAFEQSLTTMSKGGSYGDNAEIVAFAAALKVDVHVYSQKHNFFYIVPGAKEASEELPRAYIVHHDFEHFSSIRMINGPLTGKPNVQPEPSVETEEQTQKELAEKGPIIASWMIDIAMKSLPHPLNLPENRGSVEEVLKQCNGNVNYAVSLLLPDSSPESSSRSSSIERDPDSDDERAQKPSKKRDRRPHPLRNDFSIHVKEGEQISPDPRRLAIALEKVRDNKSFDPDETEEENWQEGSQSKESESSSTTSSSELSTQEPIKEGGVRLKLTAPKKPSVKSVKEVAGTTTNNEQQNTTDYEADAEKKARHHRVKAKPRRRLITGNQRNREMAEQAARNANNQKLDIGIQSIYI